MDLDGVAEPLPVLRSVQPERRAGLEADTGRRAYTLQTPAHHSQGVFGGKQEHGGWGSYRTHRQTRLESMLVRPNATPERLVRCILDLKSGSRLVNRFYCSLFLRD